MLVTVGASRCLAFFPFSDAVEDEDELEALARRVNALPTATEVRRIAPTKPRRLKRI